MKTLLLVLVLCVALVSTAAGFDYDRLVQQVEELTKRIEVLESRYMEQPKVSGMFTGQGNSCTMPFTVARSPWTLELETNSTKLARTGIGINIYTANTSTHMGGVGFDLCENVTYGKTAVYIKPGRYYLKIDTGYYIQWAIDVED